MYPRDAAEKSVQRFGLHVPTRQFVHNFAIKSKLFYFNV